MKNKSFPKPPSETGTIRKHWGGRIRVALVYPNTYAVGMANLGFQTVYKLLNDMDHVVCERAFLPGSASPLRSMESVRPLSDFHIIAFSVSFESDYPHILTILDAAGIPFASHMRNEDFPLILAGGVACFLNPEPLAVFMDAFLLGEAEELLPPFFRFYHPGEEREKLLYDLARNVPGVYVPAFYRPEYRQDGSLESFAPIRDVPEKIASLYLPDLSLHKTCSVFLTQHSIFPQTFLLETGRGCPHGCRFCSAGYIYRPPRFRPPALLKECIEEGISRTNQIGLMGTAVSDLPGIGDLCKNVSSEDIRISFSSLRADALTPELLHTLKNSRVKTATIAPDAGSERMRRVINKGLAEEDILNAAEMLVAEGIPNLKLYFMIGLPTEREEDIEAIQELCARIKGKFLRSSRAKGRMGEITVSLNCFVPKALTPFQWAGTEDMRKLKGKQKSIQNALRKIPNVRLHFDNPRQAYVQALLARGDRRVSGFLKKMHRYQGNLPQSLKETSLDTDSLVYPERDADELFPWDFIGHRVKKSFLRREYEKALENRPSPPCPMTSGCGLCGGCVGEEPLS
ncbi:MAG: radical SAM protein [Desulfococcaceae bacterium]|jgi:radical SAM superfamily enzyme YgiQ (UPF0313 family)|nr:radical SAM protein [Desulfococcaceae bacterium]